MPSAATIRKRELEQQVVNLIKVTIELQAKNKELRSKLAKMRREARR